MGVKKQRVRVTNKALEARQFSTLRLPKKSEVQPQKVDVARMFEDDRGREEEHLGDARAEGSETVRQPAALAFDPIPSDPMFFVVGKSKYWPPPSLEQLHTSAGVSVVSDGFDMYDRREDDKRARKERTKPVRGELNHPRGKPRQNTIVQLEDGSSGDDKDDEGVQKMQTKMEKRMCFKEQ